MNASNKMKLKKISDQLEMLKTGLKEVRKDEEYALEVIQEREEAGIAAADTVKVDRLEQTIHLLQISISEVDILQSRIAQTIDL